MIIRFESATGPVEVDTESTYTVEATGIYGWMMASILAMLGNSQCTITLSEERRSDESNQSQEAP